MTILSRLITACLIGMVSSSVVFVAAYATKNGFAIGLLVSSGTPTASVVAWVLPESFWHWAVPEGGVPAAVLLFVISAWVQLSILSGVVAYLILSHRNIQAPSQHS